MRKIFLCLIFFFAIFLFFRGTSFAIYNPTSLPNNKFGIHIVDSNDIEAAAELVNSSSENKGDWGYLTVIIQDTDREQKKWSEIFERLRIYHLIPILRLATHGENGDTWAKPKPEESLVWAQFLNKLPWPVKNRYIILFNEPNHAKEWGGALAADEYAQVASEFADSLHKTSDNFFILPAGFDLYAAGVGGTMEASAYWRLMDKQVPGIFSKFDGWTSHSYPKNEFSGSPYDFGRYSIRGFEWELSYLTQNFQVKASLPVFITETGWSQKPSLSRETIAGYFKTAFESVWTDDRIVAVTPFLLNYQAPPFASFSWKKSDGSFFSYF